MRSFPIVFPVLAVLTGIIPAGPQGQPSNNNHHLVINEIMYAPQGGESEWVEIFNRGDTMLDLAGWTIEDADSSTPRILSTRSQRIDAGGYTCIVQDSGDFQARFPESRCQVIQPTNGWPRLNNSGDRIALRNAEGLIVDALVYDDSWGGSDGFSLERIHPDRPTDQRDSWASSVSNSMATPCEQNSIFFRPLPREASLTVNPDPFEGETTISYRLTVSTAMVKLSVYDIQGRLVKILIDQEPSGSTGSIIWRGESDSGKDLRVGIYILYLEAVNSEMGVLDRVKKSITLAKRLR